MKRGRLATSGLLFAFGLAACAGQPEGVDPTYETAASVKVPPEGYFHIANGLYKGAGKWTTSDGNSGTLTDTTDFDATLLTNNETATYSDGLVIPINVKYVEVGGSNYNVEVDDGTGNFVVVGYGACSQNQCVTNVSTPALKANELATYNSYGLFRNGAFQLAGSNVWRFYNLAEVRQ